MNNFLTPWKATSPLNPFSPLNADSQRHNYKQAIGEVIIHTNPGAEASVVVIKDPIITNSFSYGITLIGPSSNLNIKTVSNASYIMVNDGTNGQRLAVEGRDFTFCKTESKPPVPSTPPPSKNYIETSVCCTLLVCLILFLSFKVSKQIWK